MRGALTSDYDFDLPPELIAQAPLARRDASRLMVLDRAAGTIAHRTFDELPESARAAATCSSSTAPRS